MQPKLTFICNPNNPTGTLLDLESIRKLLETTQGIVVVDEAYAEFCDVSAACLIGDYPNLIVLRTFSKAYGLAGARIGYGLAQKELIGCLEVVKPPYNINCFSQEVARYVLTHRDAFMPTIEAIRQTRDHVRETLLADRKSVV